MFTILLLAALAFQPVESRPDRRLSVEYHRKQVCAVECSIDTCVAEPNNLGMWLHAAFQGEWVKAEGFARSALQSARKEKNTFREAQALNCLGIALVRQYKFSQAEESYLASSRLFKDLSDEKCWLESLSNLAQLYLELGLVEDSRALNLALFDYHSKKGKHADSAYFLMQNGHGYYYQREFARAATCYEHGVALLERAKDGHNLEIAYGFQFLARCQIATGKYPKAEEYFGKAIKACPSMEEEVRQEKTMLLLGIGETKDAEDLCREVLRSIKKKTGTTYADGVEELGFVALKKSEFDLASKCFLECLEIRKKTLGPSHPLIALALENLSTALISKGMEQEARGLLAQARMVRKKASERHRIEELEPIIRLLRSGISRFRGFAVWCPPLAKRPRPKVMHEQIPAARRREPRLPLDCGLHPSISRVIIKPSPAD